MATLNQEHPASTQFTIAALPPNASHAQSIDYKRIRLSGLYTDSHAFGSTYARESLFTPETWFTRVNGQARKIFFATPTPTNSSTSRNMPTYPGWNSPEESTPNEPWMGTVCVLWPEMIKSIPPVEPYPSELASLEEKGEVDVHMLVGMWVHPDSRRSGVGKALVDAALRSVYSEVDAEKQKKVVVLKVHKANKAAFGLYKALGFSPAGAEDESGETWMIHGL